MMIRDLRGIAFIKPALLRCGREIAAAVALTILAVLALGISPTDQPQAHLQAGAPTQPSPQVAYRPRN